MKREELIKKKKRKVLLRGGTGVGKSYTIVRAAEAVASKGGKVLILDTQRGCVDHLEKLNDEVLQNIEHRDCFRFEDMQQGALSNEYDMIAIDLLSSKQFMARLRAKEKILSQGWYMIGEKKIVIENPETYMLSGFSYMIPNEWEIKLMESLIQNRAHVICASCFNQDFEKEPGVGENLDGYFDLVLKLYYEDREGKREYKAIIAKNRINPEKEGLTLSDPAQAMAKLFGGL